MATSGSDLEPTLDPARHQGVPQEREGRVEQRLDGGRSPPPLLFPREAQQILHDPGRALRLIANYGDRLAERRRHIGAFRQKLREPDDRCQRVVQVVRNAGNELADGRHLFRLHQLVLEAVALGLVVENQHNIGAARPRERRNGGGIDPIAEMQLDLADRSFRPDGALEIRDPFGRNQRLPGTPDERVRRCRYQPGKGPIGTAYAFGFVDQTQGRRNRVEALLPRPARRVNSNRCQALQGEAGQGGQCLGGDQVRGAK